jgi:hypothetical protein
MTGFVAGGGIFWPIGTEESQKHECLADLFRKYPCIIQMFNSSPFPPWDSQNFPEDGILIAG